MFTVLGNYDLNKNPSLKQSYGVSSEKTICCGLCKSDPLTVNFSVLKQGYVPGERIAFNVNINNKSNKELSDMLVDLYQIIYFHGTTKTYTDKRVVKSIKYPSNIKQHSQINWENSDLLIPPVCASGNGTCKLIVVEYQLVLKYIESSAESKELKIPLVIGTMPLSQELLNSPVTYENDSFIEIYAVALDTKDDDKGELIESNTSTYKPVYPYYKDLSLQ